MLSATLSMEESFTTEQDLVHSDRGPRLMPLLLV